MTVYAQFAIKTTIIISLVYNQSNQRIM